MYLKLDPRPAASATPAVAADGHYQPVSFWQQTVNVAPGPPLAEHLACDVCIVGGGFTGMSIAYELKKAAPQLDVVVLESGVVGHGASGRNGGFVMPLLGWDLSDAVHKLGPDKARTAYQMMYDAVNYVKTLVRSEQIDCDLESTGYLLVATCKRRERAMRREAQWGERLGFDHQWLDADGVAEHIRCPGFRTGVFDPHPAIINPAKLARGWKPIVERLGVRVFEQSPMTELLDDSIVHLRTPQGSVRAAKVVLCVNGYGAALGFMPQRVIPVHTYIVLTEPLTSEQVDLIGWSRRASLETARNFIHYFRLTADNRIAFGGEDAQLYWRGAHRDWDSTCFTALERRFRQYFPALAGVQFTHRWGGTLGVTLDMFPTFGRGGHHGNIFHAAGYSGHGVALSNYAGHLMTPHILAGSGHKAAALVPSAPFFFDRQPPLLPPEPLRYLGLHAYRQMLRGLDRIEGA